MADLPIAAGLQLRRRAAWAASRSPRAVGASVSPDLVGFDIGRDAKIVARTIDAMKCSAMRAEAFIDSAPRCALTSSTSSSRRCSVWTTSVSASRASLSASRSAAGPRTPTSTAPTSLSTLRNVSELNVWRDLHALRTVAHLVRPRRRGGPRLDVPQSRWRRAPTRATLPFTRTTPS
jgi:hypothetical protein